MNRVVFYVKTEFYFLMAELKERVMKGGRSVFGNILVYTTLQLYYGNQSITLEPTPFGFCLDIEQLLNIVTYNQAKQISRLKLQVDEEKEFLKIFVNIISMSPDRLYTPTPNSVLSNFVITMGHGVDKLSCNFEFHATSKLQLNLWDSTSFKKLSVSFLLMAKRYHLYWHF